MSKRNRIIRVLAKNQATNIGICDIYGELTLGKLGTKGLGIGTWALGVGHWDWGIGAWGLRLQVPSLRFQVSGNYKIGKLEDWKIGRFDWGLGIGTWVLGVKRFENLKIGVQVSGFKFRKFEDRS